MTEELLAKEKTAAVAEAEPTMKGPVFVPPVDIYESEDAMTLVADMPGVDKRNLTIDLKDNTLSIHGKIPIEAKADRRLLYGEFESGDFYRRFSLSETIDQTEITASLQNGVLTLRLPKIQPARPRRITVAGE